MDSGRWMGRWLVLLLVFAAMALGTYTPPAAILPAASTPASGSGVADTSEPASDTFVFGAVGDFDNKAPGFPDMVALAKRLGNHGGVFLLALGDLGYVADEQQWCNAVKGAFNTTLVVAGNHDTTENGPGDINSDVVYCPFNVDASVVPGPKYGYGKSYYFDYPRQTPLVRVIMITAGTSGTQVSGQNYGAGGAEYNWVVDAVNAGRGAGIPWTVVGLHKMCITVGSKSGCEMGQALFDKLVELKVDLILQAHDHVYERSKQLALSANCTTVPAAGGFDADCVVANGTRFSKGVGSIVVVDGAGGRDLYNVNLGGTDRELGYFDAVMGNNANTQGKSTGHGTFLVNLNATSLTGTTDFCPLGSGNATTGECPAKVPTVFSDHFTILSDALPPPPPPPLTAAFTSSPAAPLAGEIVSFAASASGGTQPYSYAWSFGDGSTGGGDSPGHSYAQAGDYAVNLTVTDAQLAEAKATGTVTVLAPPGSPAPPVTTLVLKGALGANSWYTSSVEVSLSSTGSSPVTIGYRLDGAAWMVYRGPFDVLDGRHTMEYNGTDDRGNAEATHTATFQIDTIAPTTTAHLTGTRGRGPWYVTPVTVALVASDGTSGVASTTWRLDGLAWQGYSSPLQVVDGRHVLEWASTDAAGLVETTRSIGLQVDTSPPRVLLSPSNGVETVSSVALSWTESDEVAGILESELSVDRGPFVSVASNTSAVFVLSDGDHIVSIRVVDAAGNVAVGEWNVRVDTNIFSPTGPLRGSPSFFLLMMTLVGMFLLVRSRSRRKRARRRASASRRA